MSMPSSSDEVATIARSVPAFRASSTSSRCSRASDPWWARTSSSPARSFSRVASRSARRRAFTNTIVDRCARISSSSRGWIAGQTEASVGDRPAVDGPSTRGCFAGGSRTSVSCDMSSTGTSTTSSIGLRCPASTILTGRASPSSSPPRNRAISSSGRWVALQPDPLGGRVREGLQPFERQRQVGAALGGGHRVDLVDDHDLDVSQGLARRRGEHQVERLGSGDQDVGRRLQHPAPVGGGGVARAHSDDRLVRQGSPGLLGDAAHPRHRRTKVLLDVDRQCPQGRDIDHSGAPGRPGRRLGAEAVDRPQEGCQGLARAGGRQDQGVLAGGDRRPAGLLSERGRVERALEPGAHRGRESLQAHGVNLPRAGDMGGARRGRR